MKRWFRDTIYNWRHGIYYEGIGLVTPLEAWMMELLRPVVTPVVTMLYNAISTLYIGVLDRLEVTDEDISAE